ncbi:hypothetical protein K438DRAFT_1783052 [Mycena galopus ATCC 62051]|nr:hypothetical protein K438DRAFT_1783052 [Mycena galopus ATCC 62051]
MHLLLSLNCGIDSVHTQRNKSDEVHGARLPTVATLCTLSGSSEFDPQRPSKTLIRTSLAYVGGAGELKVLAPIREYTERVRPPSPPLVAPLRAHLSSVLKIWGSHRDLSGVAERDMTPRLVSNLGNFHNLLEYGLNSDIVDLKQSMECIMLLNRLHGIMNRGPTPLLLCLLERLNELNDPKLSGEFIINMFQEWQYFNVIDPEKSVYAYKS